MASFYRVLRPLIFCLSPETAHHLALRALPFLPRAQNIPSLCVDTLGLTFPNPVGLAAGFDKNADVTSALLAQGFGFVEAGTVTPKAQPGNVRPRIFRLKEDEAIINRLGFNNDGLEKFVARLNVREKKSGIVGANIGKNKDSTDAAADYVQGLKAVGNHADYVTINISSPNTEGLRALQKREALEQLLSALESARQSLGKRVPLLLKISPDLGIGEREDIAQLAITHGIDGLILTNTTIARPPALKSWRSHEQGGLSGRPLFAPSTEALSHFYRLTGGKITLIGVGGISSAEDTYEKIRAGATLVQLYTALIYQGFGLVREIQDGLAALLARDGLKTISQAVGLDAR